MRKQSETGMSHPQSETGIPHVHPLVDTNRHFVLGDRFHSAADPHKSHLCKYHNVDLCLQANTIKTSTVESQNYRKNQRRLRSSTLHNFETHVSFNYLMDFYQNAEVR